MGLASRWTLSLPELATGGSSLPYGERNKLDISLQFSGKSGANKSFSACNGNHATSVSDLLTQNSQDGHTEASS